MKNKPYTRMLISVIACGCALAWSVRAFADTITLKTAARQRDGVQTIALSDIASLAGDEAQRLADVQVASIKPGAGKPLEVSVADVRRALDAAGANWAKVNLSGRSVIVRPARAADSLPPQAMASVAIEADAPAGPQRSPALALDSIVHERTIRGSIAVLIVTSLRVDPREIRLASSADDAAILATSLDSGRFQVHPLGSLAGDRVVFEVRVWNGATVESKGQIAFTVERMMPETHAVRDLSRGSTIAEGDVQMQSRWMSASEALQTAPLAALVGRSLTRSISAGEAIRVRDVAQEAIIRRGDLVNVRCLVGSVAISIQAEARGEGCIGDAVEVRKSGERESFMARITGRGEAVVDLARR